MVDLTRQRLPGLALALLGVALVVWSGVGIWGLTLGDPGPAVEVTATAVERPPAEDRPEEEVIYEFGALTDREQRVLERAIDGDGPVTVPGRLQHLRGGGDYSGPGHGRYYVSQSSDYYRVDVEGSDPSLDTPLGVVAWGLVLVVGLVTAGVGRASARAEAVRLPAALLAGYAVLSGAWLLDTRVRLPWLGEFSVALGFVLVTGLGYAAIALLGRGDGAR